MKVLVTGALGAIGSQLTPELVRRDHDVYTCDLRHGADEVRFSAGGAAGARYMRGDVGDYRQLARVFEHAKPDLVYHLAAEFGRWNGEDFYETLWRSNAVGTKNVVRMQEQRGFRLVFFSSSEVYGDWPGTMAESVTEERALPLLNDYALSKWVGEAQIRNSAARHGTESVVVRLFNTYGPGEYYSPYRSVNCVFLYRALHNRPFTVYGGHSRTSTYVGDTVHTLANITENFCPGETYNIAGDRLHTVEELARVALTVVGAEPGLAVYADAPEPMTTKSKRVNVEKARRDLGHRAAVGLEEGMERTADWMREVYRL